MMNDAQFYLQTWDEVKKNIVTQRIDQDVQKMKEIEKKFKIYENFWKLQKYFSYPFKINE